MAERKQAFVGHPQKRIPVTYTYLTRHVLALVQGLAIDSREYANTRVDRKVRTILDEAKVSSCDYKVTVTQERVLGFIATILTMTYYYGDETLVSRYTFVGAEKLLRVTHDWT